MAKKYNHYCPVAFTLELVGGRWSYTIIRDLLRNPQRFSDLMAYSRDITPKGLTLALRQLEEAGIIRREERPGRREVWYRLTPAGEDLRPVVEAMKEWGLKHAMRPPLPGEIIRPDLAVGTLADSLNQSGRALPQPAWWRMCFSYGGTYDLGFDGSRWFASSAEREEVDLTIAVSPESWVEFMAVKRSERSRLLPFIQLGGSRERVQEFLAMFTIIDKEVQLEGHLAGSEEQQREI